MAGMPTRSRSSGAFRSAVALVAAALAAALLPAAGCAQGSYEQQRARLVAEIEAAVARSSGSTGRERLTPAVSAAMRKVPRHEFVPVEVRAGAYLNSPLPIGDGQTISQPYIVALMTELADVGPMRACSRSARAPDIRLRCLRKSRARSTRSKSSRVGTARRRDVAGGSVTATFTCAPETAIWAGRRLRRSIASS